MNENTVKMAILGECLESVVDYRGKTPPKSPNGIPTITAANVKSGRIDMSTVSYVSEKTYWEWSTRGFPEAADVLITTEAPVGEVAPFPGDQTYLITRRVFAMRGKKGVLDNAYLLYTCLSSIVQDELQSRIRGSTVPRVLKTDILGLQIPLPSIDEQKAIAHILGTIDDKIELNRKTNETLEAMAKALFKSWFVDFDPVRAKVEGRPTGLPAEISDLFPDSFEDSELGEIPSGWEPRTIREWGRTECGKTPSTHNQEFYGNDYMFVTIPDLHNGLHVVSSGKQLSKLGADSQRKKLLPPGSVMVSCIATPGLVGVAKEACFTNQQINSIIPNSKEASWFLALAMIENRDLLLSLGGGGSVFFNLSKGRFDEIEILAPSEDLISAFSGVVSALMDRCFATKQETIALAKTRDTLLPKLISGEIRIPDAEKMLEEVGV
jgi:type I restriction enzyme S subunit